MTVVEVVVEEAAVLSGRTNVVIALPGQTSVCEDCVVVEEVWNIARRVVAVVRMVMVMRRMEQVDRSCVLLAIALYLEWVDVIAHSFFLCSKPS